MIRALALIGLVSLAACSSPRLNAGVSLGADGLSVTPSLSGRVAGLGVAISP